MKKNAEITNEEEFLAARNQGMEDGYNNNYDNPYDLSSELFNYYMEGWLAGDTKREAEINDVIMHHELH